MPDSEKFRHLPLRLVSQGIASPPLGGKSKVSDTTLKNQGNIQGHSSKLKSSIDVLTINWQEEQKKRKEDGNPDLPNALSFILQVDPDAFDADTLKGFGIEVILEVEDGYILGASTDIELTKLQQKIQKFIASEHGGGTVAKIWEIVEGKFKRLEYILSPDLLASWNKILDEHIYTVEVSIACVGLNSKFSEYPKPKKGKDEDLKKYAKKIAKWIDKRDQTMTEWDALHLERESDFEAFVKELGGTFLQLSVHDDRSHFALLPDSFSSQIEISGKGLKDIAANYPYVFEISEIAQVSELLTDQTGLNTNENSFVLEPPLSVAPKVCIIDSGILEGHSKLRAALDCSHSRSWVPGEINNTNDDVKGGGHGTRVAGAVLYPQGIPNTESQQAICWLQNARVLNKDCRLPDLLPLPKVLSDIVDFYYGETGTRIYNHSINSSSPCSIKRMSVWATEIDYLSWKKDILFIVSAGNLPIERSPGLTITRQTLTEHFQKGHEYPDFLLQDSSRIANPAQSLQALTVGSIAHKTYKNSPLKSIAKEDYPSSFSCSGLGIWDTIKPEVVEYGGDLVKDESNPPSFYIHPDVCPELVRTTTGGAPAIASDMIGTSFAAPKVTHIAAALAATFPHETTLFYRALIVQSARLPDWTNESVEKLYDGIRMMGYGLPNLDRALGNSLHRITLTTQGDQRISARQAKVYQVSMPENLSRQGQEFDILVEITLSYKAEPRRTRRQRRKYLSTWLDWTCSKKGEDPQNFLEKVLKEYNEAPKDAEKGEGLFDWTLGRRQSRPNGDGERKTNGIDGRVKKLSRSTGTIQKDWAIVKSFDLRKPFCIAVVGHEGWNNDPTSQVPYSLVVSFEAINSEISIYNAFVQVEKSLQVRL